MNVCKKNTQPNNGGEPPLWFVMRVEWWMASSAPATWIVGFYYSHRAEPFSFPSGRIRINRRAVTILLFALEAAEPDWKITLTAAKAICAPRFFDPCSNTAHCRRVASNKPMRDCVAECIYVRVCVVKCWCIQVKLKKNTQLTAKCALLYYTPRCLFVCAFGAHCTPVCDWTKRGKRNAVVVDGAYIAHECVWRRAFMLNDSLDSFVKLFFVLINKCDAIIMTHFITILKMILETFINIRNALWEIKKTQFVYESYCETNYWLRYIIGN